MPTCSLLHHRSIIQSNVCQRCYKEEESFLHCVRDCQLSKSNWHSLGFRDREFFQGYDVVAFLRSGMSRPNHKLFLAGLWWAWRARNIQCLNQENISLLKLLYSVHVWHTTLRGCFPDMTLEARQEKWVMWHPPRDNKHVLNVNGSRLGNPGRAGVGD